MCSKTVVTDEQLVDFLLQKFKLSRQTVLAEFRAAEPAYKPLEPILTKLRPLAGSREFYIIPVEILRNLRSIFNGPVPPIDDASHGVIIGDLTLQGCNYRVIHGFFNKPSGDGADDFGSWCAFGIATPIGSLDVVCYLGELAKYNTPQDLASVNDIQVCHQWYNQITLGGTSYLQEWWRLPKGYVDENN
ncbi:MAG: hypothetical protein H0X02_09495 [Nitrosomonas sp.]|nr:hypothetical protein [Nitrosomonas sp.]